MGKLSVKTTSLEGFLLLEPTVFSDERGYFLESYNERELQAAGIDVRFVQDNESRSVGGTLRGLHFQTAHAQDKLVRVIFGEVLDVVVDLRAGSATFGKWESVVLSGENKLQAFIPKGFAHGFVVRSESAVFSYKCSDFYDPASEAGILWNDASLGIDWGIESPLLSPKDRVHPTLTEAIERGIIHA